MPFSLLRYNEIASFLKEKNVLLVAASKFQPVEEITAAYNAGIRNFGENYIQELVPKYELLSKDINWHFIGHLQSNKVKYIANFIHLIQGVDSLKLLTEINKQAQNNNRKIDCLLQVHIAEETTKFGFDKIELMEVDPLLFPNVNIKGIMGMATFTDDQNIIAEEFSTLKNLSENFIKKVPGANVLSMGMTADYKLAIEKGSNMVRIGSLL
ncbi:MAG: YggS family pyridoxal phosphate-dependent enzyme, partial [Ferruginibacter sp.]